jgi:acyl-CoA synthetase (AMP-forming)/AMP-acid ligase II
MATSNRLERLTELREVLTTLVWARLLVAMRPDKYVRMVAAVRREGTSTTIGIATSARRCPARSALVDEIGTLSYRELDVRCNSFAAALQALRGGTPETIGIMCRNHRGFVEALAAANKVGADVLLLNTSFAGPALADVVAREGVDTVVYDEEFTSAVERALADNSGCRRIVGWTDDPDSQDVTVEKLISAHIGQRAEKATRSGKLILLTSGTTGTPKGAKHSGGGPNELKVLLERVPWRAEETTVIAAPMFHAWGLGQLLMSTIMACTVVTRRNFDPEATLELVDRYRASGLSVVPVMLDRIMELPTETLQKYSGRSLRFANASGSRMRPDVVIAFMDRFGDIVYNNYNATEAGMIAVATPADLRAAPDTAGRPAVGTEIRILGDDFRQLTQGETGQIFVHNASQFDGYTSGNTKDFHDGFMASGDVGYLDDVGRLFVVGRDDEMIVSGGENVYPIEVEKTLVAHDGVAEASVIGVDDEKYGQRLVAFVVLEDGASATPETLKQHIRDSLANYKVPRDITILNELPRSNTGKIVRSELQAHAAPGDES